MKKIALFVGHVLKCMVGSVACVALIGFTGYYISLGLNWLTGVVIKFLMNSVEYLMGNWVAVVAIVIALTLGRMAYESLTNWCENRRNKKKNQ